MEIVTKILGAIVAVAILLGVINQAVVPNLAESSGQNSVSTEGDPKSTSYQTPHQADSRVGSIPSTPQRIDRAFREQLIELLRAEPEIIIHAIRMAEENAQKRQQVEMEKLLQKRKLITAAFSDGGLIKVTHGNSDPPHELAFFEYGCSSCTLPQTEFIRPIGGETGTAGEMAARAVIASERQGKQMLMHQSLSKSGVTLTPTGIMSAAAEAGLDLRRLIEDLVDDSITDLLTRNRSLAIELGWQPGSVTVIQAPPEPTR